MGYFSICNSKRLRRSYMTKVKFISLYLVAVMLFCFLTGCSNINSNVTSNNNSNDINSDNTQNDNTNSNNSIDDDSNNDINDDISDDETLLIESIPQEFVFLGEIYTIKRDAIDTSSFANMIGYLINEEDLTFWKTYDKNDDIMYAIDTGNGTYRHSFENNLKNRYELYTKDDSYDCLAIKDSSNTFIIFYIFF